MSASEAQILANRQNSLRSTGPRTEEGKARSRGNALKHGMTGEGVVLPAEDAAEVERLNRSYETELKPTSDLGRTLVRRMALMTVRMDRCVAHETATLSVRVRQAEADFDAEWPQEEGRDDPHRARRRLEAARVAMFDPSREATLARKYEAAAERGFFRSLKELRRVEKDARVANPAPAALPARSSLGSSLPVEVTSVADEVMAAKAANKAPVTAPKAVAPTAAQSAKPAIAPSLRGSPLVGSYELPFTIGRVR